MKGKKMGLQRSEWNNGVDLLIERDSGNEILILMGGHDHALRDWKHLRRLCTKAIKLLEGGTK